MYAAHAAGASTVDNHNAYRLPSFLKLTIPAWMGE